MSDKKWNQLLNAISNGFFDLGKLTFGSLILGSVLRGGLDPFQVFAFGAGTAIFLFVAGALFINISEE